MKKAMKFFWLLAAVAMMFSCQKETGDTPGQQPANDTEEQTSPAGPGIQDLDPDVYLVGFSAQIENVRPKVSIDVDKGTLSFENGDNVLVVSGNEHGIYIYNNGTFAPETIEDAVPVGEARAYYPADDFSEDGATFMLPSAITAGRRRGDFQDPLLGLPGSPDRQ